MNISGIRPSNGFYDDTNIKFRPELSSMAADELEDSKVEESAAASTAISDEEVAAARAGQTFGSYDFASQYKPGEIHSLKGTDSDIGSLDIKKAVTDMQKDSAIHRYQYFVQNKKDSNGAQPQKGTENFTL
ncbi:MAG: hypothetical protein IKP29_00455 [Pseudobutyrivibrio sp.]|nr:hypothetical protein [Pseudobutyrivibrio sp.]